MVLNKHYKTDAIPWRLHPSGHIEDDTSYRIQPLPAMRNL